MKKNTGKTQKNIKLNRLIKLYQEYKNLKAFSDCVPKKHLPSFTLDEKIENINPYYVKNELVKYG